MRPAPRALLVALAVLALAAADARAHFQQFTMTGKTLLVASPRNARQRKFLFKATVQTLLLRDPSLVGSALVVQGTGANRALSGLIELDKTRWRRVGLNAYRYTDRKGTRGGVKSVLFKSGRGGGKVEVVAGGPRWPLVVTGKQDSVWVLFRVEQEWYCAQFGGRMQKNKSGHLQASNAKAPSACPATVCGNGVTEVGEDCDDGNLDNADGCTTACVLGVCAGQTFASTWEAIQKVILAGNGCADSTCHNPAAPGGAAGGLDLTGDPYGRLVRVKATNSTLNRVEPGDQDLSFFWLKLAAGTLPAQYPDVGSPMPSGGRAPISADALEALRLWIRHGAPETGVVENTGDKLSSCLPPADPQKIPPLDPPAFGTGVQLYAPPWNLPHKSENEVCYATYYDFTQTPGLVPDSAKTPCPPWMGGAGKACFRYHVNELAQDPQSHHSIINLYVGTAATSDPSWGAWTCLGGANSGKPCDPKAIGPQGWADCGPRSACSSAVKRSLACIGFGPPDLQTASRGFGGSQESLSLQEYAPGVYNVIPMQGIVVWNSHAFNLTTKDTTMEQYFNLTFAGPQDQLYQVRGIFDASEIFVASVLPFTSHEYCRTLETSPGQTLPVNTHLFELSSHTHKRGILFRIWAPPNAPCTAAGGCKSNDPDPPIYVSTQYNDPVKLRYSTPLVLDDPNPDNRRYKFCLKYDNGEKDPATVKRASTSPIPPLPIGGPCGAGDRRCVGGPKQGQLCNGNDAVCQGGVCDACPLTGGVTTEDEMFILLGSYYVTQ
jgi:cysteine-rich repeat protein